MGKDPRSFSNALDDNPLSYWHAKIDNSKSDTVTATFKERSLSSTNYSGDPGSRIKSSEFNGTKSLKRALYNSYETNNKSNLFCWNA